MRISNGDDVRGGVIICGSIVVAAFVEFGKLPALNDNV
jgi:hypothetical protein